MGLEIERKFLVIGDGWNRGKGQRITQGYLNRDKERTVRVRIAGNEAFLTIKGATRGASRAEFEYPIPLQDAQQLIGLCERPVIDKLRHVLVHDGMAWEVDEFKGANLGLLVAEIELTHESQRFTKPAWVGEEVTDDPRYHNSALSSHPYAEWKS